MYLLNRAKSKTKQTSFNHNLRITRTKLLLKRAELIITVILNVFSGFIFLALIGFWLVIVRIEFHYVRAAVLCECQDVLAFPLNLQLFVTCSA